MPIIERSEIKKPVDIISQLAAVYDCKIGSNVFIGNFTEIRGAEIGSMVYIDTHVKIEENVFIGNEVYIGSGTKIITIGNPSFSRRPSKVEICDEVHIGTNCIIGGGVRIGKGAEIRSGSVVLEDVRAYETYPTIGVGK